MNDKDEIEVVEGEIVDDGLEASQLPVSPETRVERKDGGLEKAGKFMEKIALVGGIAFKLFSVFKNSSSPNGYRDTGEKVSSRGRRKRKRGNGSV